MRANRPSLTAQGAALHRAAHQIVDIPPVFADPLALRIIGPKAEEDVRAGRERHTKPTARFLRAFVAARSRYTEDCFTQAAARGVNQYVVLGAGLDTFAYRTDRAGLRIFEVDHPATQGWKRERLADARIAVPKGLAFAPVDFECERLDVELTRAGFDFGQPAFFAWLGVVPYLTRDAVTATLDLMARKLKPDSEVLFDYAEPPQTRGYLQHKGFAALAARAAKIGEPFRSFFVTDDLLRELRALGFSFVEDANAPALNARYFQGRQDGLALGGAGHIMRARV